MANMYRTEEVGDVMETIIDKLCKRVVDDDKLTNDDLISVVRNIRLFVHFKNEVIAELIKEDEKYEQRIAEWKAMREDESKEDEDDGTDS